MASPWETEWFLRQLMRFLAHDDGVRLALCALTADRYVMVRVLTSLHGHLAPISRRALVITAVECGWWEAVITLHHRLARVSKRRTKDPTRFNMRPVLLAIQEAVLACPGDDVFVGVMKEWELRPMVLPPRVLYQAAARGRLEEVIWLHHVVKWYDPREAIEYAARGRHGRVIQWLVDHANEALHPDDWTQFRSEIRLEDTMLADVQVISWRETSWNIAYAFVGDGGGLWPSHREFRGKEGYPLMDHAASVGDVKLLALFNAHSVARNSLSSAALPLATTNGHRDAIKWLMNHRQEESSASLVRAMAEGAKNGDLALLRWIHEQWGPVHGSMTAVFEAAAASGDVHVVKWLFETYLDQRIRPRYLIYPATGSGKLDMVKYLCEEQGYSVSVEALKRAVVNGYLDIAKWLWARLSIGSAHEMSEIVHLAAKGGHLPTFKWVVELLGLWSELAVVNAASAQLLSGHILLQYLFDRDATVTTRMLRMTSVVRLLLVDCDETVSWIIRTIPEAASDEIRPSDIHWFGSIGWRLDAVHHFRKHRIARRNDPHARLSSHDWRHDFLRFRPRFCREIAAFPVWAVLKGRIDWLMQLEAIRHPNLFSKAVRRAILLNTRDADVVLWFLNRKPEFFPNRVVITKWAAKYGSLSVLNRIMQLPESPPSDTVKVIRVALWNACRNGHVEVLSWLSSGGYLEEVTGVWTGLHKIASDHNSPAIALLLHAALKKIIDRSDPRR